jgi:hypothetical protein
MPDRLVIVVPYPEESATRKRIVGLAVLGWENSVRLVGGPTQRGGGNDARTALSRKILQIADEFKAESLIVAKEISWNGSMMQARQSLDIRRAPVGHIRNTLVPREREARGDYIGVEGLKTASVFGARRKATSVIGSINLVKLGIPWVGEGLLRQLDVIDPNEIVGAFDTPALVSLNAMFTYISHSDPASSSIWIGGLLARIYGRPRVKDFVAALGDAKAESHLIICEDALWTGTELRSVLTRLSTGDLSGAAKGKRITFRHCVVTDYGLWIAQQYIFHAHMELVDLSLDEKQRFIRVLPQDLSEAEVRSRWDMPPVEFEDWLTTYVRPGAFQNVELWEGRQEEAQGICAEIGRQLIEPYRVEMDKNWRQEVLAAFPLGAARFGSVTAFAHSVPKVCLPMLWLGGP